MRYQIQIFFVVFGLVLIFFPQNAYSEWKGAWLNAGPLSSAEGKTRTPEKELVAPTEKVILPESVEIEPSLDPTLNNKEEWHTPQSYFQKIYEDMKKNLQKWIAEHTK